MHSDAEYIIQEIATMSFSTTWAKRGWSIYIGLQINGHRVNSNFLFREFKSPVANAKYIAGNANEIRTETREWRMEYSFQKNKIIEW